MEPPRYKSVFKILVLLVSKPRLGSPGKLNNKLFSLSTSVEFDGKTNRRGDFVKLTFRDTGTVYTTSEEFENGGFTLKTREMVFRPHYAGGI